MVSPTATFDDDDDPRNWLLIKAAAYGFVSVLFGVLWAITMIVPDPVLFVDEVVTLLATAVTARAAAKNGRKRK